MKTGSLAGAVKDSWKAGAHLGFLDDVGELADPEETMVRRDQ